MGLGVLGQACAKAIAPIGYKLAGWTRAPKQIDGVACFSGAGGLDAFLAATDILVVLLPLTPDTHGPRHPQAACEAADGRTGFPGRC